MGAMITKRQFLAAQVCETFSRFEREAERGAVTPAAEWQFYVGNEIGRRAREVLGSGQLLPTAPRDAALSATTAGLSDERSTVLYEATLAWRSFVARADALRRVPGGWELIEVKSGQVAEDGRVNPQYVEDAAYTTFVAMASGLVVKKVSVVLINRGYRLGKPSILTDVDVTKVAMIGASLYRAKAEATEAALLSAEAPPAELKFACKSCSYFETDCVGKGIPDPLFALPHLSSKTFDELRHYRRLSNVPADFEYSEAQRKVAEVIVSGVPRVEQAGLAVLDTLVWPAYYLDFEAVQPPIPWFEDRPPYDAVPFQYSLDICSVPGIVDRHCEYLAPTEGDWRRELAEGLLIDLGTTGSIVVYSSYEKTTLNRLAQLFPDLAPRYAATAERLFDLERVFKNGYIHPAFEGRTSIKKVLPAMNVGIDYSALAIGNGGDATAVFSLMRVGRYPPETHQAHRDALLQYCGVDTKAMVLLHAAIDRLRR